VNKETAVNLNDLDFEAILEAMPDALLIVCEKGNIKAVNRKLEELSGYCKQELLEQSIELLVPHGIQQEHQQIRKNYSISPIPRLMGEMGNIHLLTKADVELPVAISLSPVEVGEGRFVIAAIRNISRRKQIEEELRYSKAGLDKAQSLAQVASWDMDITTSIVSWSAEIYRMLGLDPDGKAPSTEAFLEIIHPDDREFVRATLAEAFRARESCEIEHRLLLKDGSIKAVIQHFESVLDDDGRAIRYVGAIQDVTTQKRYESELERFRVAMEFSPDSITFTDVETMRFVYVNKVGAERIGYTQDEMLKMGPESVLDIDRQELVRMYDEAIAAGDEGTFTELEVIGKSGERLISEARRRALLLDNRWVIITITIDIAKRKEYERKLQQIHEELENRVEERTYQLQIEIEQRKKASQVKNEFLSSMSHELRTPLNSILGFAQLLELSEAEFNDTQRDYLQHILASGEHLLRLVSDLLTLNTIEEGRLSLEFSHVSTAEVIKECLNQICFRAEERNIQLVDQCGAGETLLGVWGDFMQLKQLLLTLLSNAVKYNKEGGTITVSCNEVPDNKLRISVTDTGEGVPVDLGKDLFAPFERLGREAGPIEGGGIGLSIAKRIIGLLNGEIGYESEAGQGATFWVDIPLSGEQDPIFAGLESATKTTAEEPTVSSENKPSKVLLYIEDDADNMELMRQILSIMPEFDITLLEASSGEQGIQLAGKHLPDIILMDVNLPGMSGIAAVQKLKNSAETKAIPIVAISADVNPDDIESAIASGFDAYITKPIKVAMIHQSISKILSL